MTESGKPPVAVGYARPPTSAQFKPGQSGNPTGRPKGAKNFGTAIEDELRARVTVTENGRRRRVSKREVIAKRLVNRAAEGDLRAVPLLFNEARAHEDPPTGRAVNEIFGGSEEQDVIDGIVQRIRRAHPPVSPDRTTSRPARRPEGRRGGWAGMMLSPSDYALILRYDFLSFAHRAFVELNPQVSLSLAPHLEVIATQLEACRRRKIRRLVINLPPRQLKSHLASIAFPAWWLGHNPAGHVICASYGQELAEKMARDCRRVMGSRWYKQLFPVRLAERQAVHDFATTAQGTRMATSVGGVLTGRGADLIIIDDPLKPDEALSDSRRKGVNEWYDHTLLSRLNDKAEGTIIIVMQRLHQDDLVGHVLEQEKWQVLAFPAIAEEDEAHPIESPLGRHLFRRTRGDALHPQRESAATLTHIRHTVGEYVFASQYQQNPAPLGGAMVRTKWLRFYDPNEFRGRFDEIVQSWDTANKATELSDYSVCTTWGVDGEYYYLQDVYRERLNYPDLRRKARELAHLHRADTILIEDKASGTQLIQDLKDDHVFAITPYSAPPGTDKIMRLYAQTAMFENGRVLMPRGASWLPDYLNELTSFPGSKNDDQVDSTTQALHHMRQNSSSLAIWRRLARI